MPADIVVTSIIMKLPSHRRLRWPQFRRLGAAAPRDAGEFGALEHQRVDCDNQRVSRHGKRGNLGTEQDGILLRPPDRAGFCESRLVVLAVCEIYSRTFAHCGGDGWRHQDWFFLTLFASLFKSKSRLEAENAALRHQLIVLQRRVSGRVQLTNGDRLFLVMLYRWFPSRPASDEPGHRVCVDAGAQLSGADCLLLTDRWCPRPPMWRPRPALFGSAI